MSSWTLTPENAVDYVSRRPELQAYGDLRTQDAQVIPLGGGVSNIVLRIRFPRLDMVVKQALPRLNVAEEWLASVDRLDREAACLRFLEEHLPQGTVPRFLFLDPERHVYGMTTLPDTYVPWKSRLMQGDVDRALARRIGEFLGGLHRLTWGGKRLDAAFHDLTPLHQLRLDPYYRATMARHPDLEAHFRHAVTLATECRHALVHGDFSPKNILVDGDRFVLLDYEVAHFGDPAFDVAFLINHLLLKAVYRPELKDQLLDAAGAFWRGYRNALGGGNGEEAGGAEPRAEGKTRWPADPAEGPYPDAIDELERRTLVHLGCLHLARVDGKSPAEYLIAGDQRERVRRQARRILEEADRDRREASGPDEAADLERTLARLLE